MLWCVRARETSGGDSERATFEVELAGMERKTCGALSRRRSLWASRAELSAYPFCRAVFWNDCQFPLSLQIVISRRLARFPHILSHTHMAGVDARGVSLNG